MYKVYGVHRGIRVYKGKRLYKIYLQCVEGHTGCARVHRVYKSLQGIQGCR